MSVCHFSLVLSCCLPFGKEPPPLSTEPIKYCFTSSGVIFAFSGCIICPARSSSVIRDSKSAARASTLPAGSKYVGSAPPACVKGAAPTENKLVISETTNSIAVIIDIFLFKPNPPQNCNSHLTAQPLHFFMTAVDEITYKYKIDGDLKIWRILVIMCVVFLHFANGCKKLGFAAHIFYIRVSAECISLQKQTFFHSIC